MNIRIDVVARAYLEHMIGIAVSDADWLAMEHDDDGSMVVEACREAARVAITAADLVTETLH
ncbi:hypothetical protein [Microvirga mediterraneensis]|uniref:Uncharacterized protein n=1 Tax=Microvirga mediterraneensis TaxID=2754695 RepID=A0A838BXS3_9HYPH|nr:hypothetical protein [Microvirga mediterraneensis]MBA1159376.1 hypothetical protein [Microvirga mediterraneensis]